MAASLSAYWVRFFKEAGFPSDVATKHAVVFSNNRIKPDMLADLDKPSLREMGITLMGDMISILRYAKKVIEKTTCEKLLVDTEDNKSSKIEMQQKKVTIVKNVPVKSQKKSAEVAKPKVVRDIAVKPSTEIRTGTSATVAVQSRERMAPATRVVAKTVEKVQRAETARKKKTIEIPVAESEDEEITAEESDNSEWEKAISQGRARFFGKYSTNLSKSRAMDGSKDEGTSKGKLNPSVFQRLGDSSVTSTTNVTETMKPVFNITGLNNDLLRKSFSVFNRLGDREISASGNTLKITEAEEEEEKTPEIVKRLPVRKSLSVATSLRPGTMKFASKSSGTMRADQEKGPKIASTSVRERVTIVREKKRQNNATTRVVEPRLKTMRMTNEPVGKMASERAESLPARERLGFEGIAAMKHVTFDPRVLYSTTDKSGVFSRLGR